MTDLRMAGPDDGLRVLQSAIQKNPSTEVVVMTAFAEQTGNPLLSSSEEGGKYVFFLRKG